MKKGVISLCLVLSTLFLVAGGDLSPVESIEKENVCNKDSTYIQADKNLMWQDQFYTDAEDGAYAREHNSGKVGTWSSAMNYCQSLYYANYSDWRLPTSDELQAVHRIDGQVFQYFRDKDFWTSTPTTGSRYYSVYTPDAYIYKRPKGQTNFIRCVRCTSSQE